VTRALGSFLHYLSEYVDKASRAALLLIMAVMISVILVQVFFRYVLNAAMPWPEELTIFLLSWMTFIGSGIALKNWQHIGITLFANMLPRTYRQYLSILVKITVLFCAVFLTYTGVILVQKSTHMVSDALRISMVWPRLSLPVGGGIMVIHSINMLFKEISLLFQTSEGT
jgi:TRAP-type transport system small permease protein